MMASRPPPPAKLDWASLNLANLPAVNGHVECRFSASKQTWSEPQFVADPYVKIHGLAPGLNYGQQVYEGLKAFRTADDGAIRVFRPQAHAARLRHSAAMVMLPAVPDALFLECVRLAVAGNAAFVPPPSAQGGFLYIRPVLFGAAKQLMLSPSDETVLAVYASPGTAYHGEQALDAVVLDEFDHAAPRGAGSGKLGGNYASVWRYQKRAQAQGFHLTLHLDSATRSLVEEFSTSGVLGVTTTSDGKEATPKVYLPETSNAIHSITSDSLLILAAQCGWQVLIEEVTFSSLDMFQELFAVLGNRRFRRYRVP
ncbi:aminotransferase [Apiospora phragmitis]|uniref:Aminotransferase n=1 Tax=Apiospora phragmitis TaxID=2905665 RepID=A0ABR1VDS8_9PEZI